MSKVVALAEMLDDEELAERILREAGELSERIEAQGIAFRSRGGGEFIRKKAIACSGFNWACVKLSMLQHRMPLQVRAKFNEFCHELEQHCRGQKDANISRIISELHGIAQFVDDEGLAAAITEIANELSDLKPVSKAKGISGLKCSPCESRWLSWIDKRN